MGDFIFTINVVLPLFINIIVGYFLTRMKLWDRHFMQVGNRVCFKFFIPVLLFINIYQGNFKELFNPKLIIFGISGIICVAILAIPITMWLVKENHKRGVIIQSSFRSNAILFAIPIANNIFGSEGMAVATVLIAFMVPILNLCSVIVLAIFNGGTTKKITSVLQDIIKNPLIISSTLGIISVYLGVPIPSAIQKSLMNIAAIATPLALLILGGEFEITALKKNIHYISMSVLARLVIVPTSVLAIAIFLGFKSYELVALLAAFGAPVAVGSYAMVKQAGADGELAGQLIVMTTLFSPLSFFIFIYGLKTMGFI